MDGNVWRIGIAEIRVDVKSIGCSRVIPTVGHVKHLQEGVPLEMDAEPKREGVHIGVVLPNHVNMHRAFHWCSRAT